MPNAVPSKAFEVLEFVVRSKAAMLRLSDGREVGFEEGLREDPHKVAYFMISLFA